MLRTAAILPTVGFAITVSVAPAAEYFVAPGGSDYDAGTLEAPFGSLARAQNAVAPGDTVWIRGGIYRFTDRSIAGNGRLYAEVIHLSRSGLRGAPIRYWAYGEERPVFDFSAVRPPNRRIQALHVTGSWLHLRGFELVGVQVTLEGHTQSISVASDGSHNVFERLAMHDSQAIGVYCLNGSDNLFLNCDAYRNHDYTSEGGRGGNVDGFGCHPVDGGSMHIFRGCRAWHNSDDGFDLIMARESVILENCWAFYNGYDASGQRLADGNGFKAGGYAATPAKELPRRIPRHVIRNCLAVGNKANGFYANHHPGGIDWINNSAFRNPTNFNFLGRTPDNRTDVPGVEHVVKNNLAFRGTPFGQLDLNRCTRAANTFDVGFSVTEADFRSLDESPLSGPRRKDGALPDTRFLHLDGKSALLDRGEDVGLSFQGAAPDPGCFETHVPRDKPKSGASPPSGS